MKKILFVKQLYGGLWQWQEFDHSVDTLSSENAQAGDAEALAESFAQNISTQAVVMLPGQNVLSQKQKVDETNKRHMAKLLPYEMEDSIIDPVDDLYFSFSSVANEHVDVVYTRDENISQAIESLESVGCDIQKILPDYLCLQKNKDEIVIVVDDDIVYARTGDAEGFTIELDLAGYVLSQFETEQHEREHKSETDEQEVDQIAPLLNYSVRIVSNNQEQLDKLISQFPKSWQVSAAPDISYEQGSFWSQIDTEHLGSSLNLRKGKFARQLPFKQWIDIWKAPAIIGAVAFVLAVISVSLDSVKLKNQSLELRKELQSVYQEVVPNGRSRDPVRALESMLKGTGAKDQPSNALVLVDVTAKAMQATPAITLTRMRYAGDKRELRINIESQNSGDFEQLRKAVNDAGFTAELLRVNRQGDREQASVRIAEINS